MAPQKDEKLTTVAKNLVKVGDLPIYDPAPSDKSQLDAKPQEPCALVDAVKTVRQALQSVWGQVGEAQESINHVVETGKAHTESSLGMLREEENLPLRAGFIAGGAFVGLLYAAIRRRRIFGKLFYSGIFGGLATTAVYPDDAAVLAKDVYDEGQRLSKIAINFVQGVKPGDVQVDKPVVVSEDVKILSDEDKAALNSTNNENN